jgi:hypothetical protein
MGALMQLDYLALRAGQYTFLQRLLAEYDGAHALPLLPNYAYSAAMARFKQEQQQQGCEGGGYGAASGSSSSGASKSTMQQQQRSGRSRAGGETAGAGDEEVEKGSHELMVQALLLHPLVLPQLQGRLQGLGVGKDSGWQKLLERKLYAQVRLTVFWLRLGLCRWMGLIATARATIMANGGSRDVFG